MLLLIPPFQGLEFVGDEAVGLVYDMIPLRGIYSPSPLRVMMDYDAAMSHPNDPYLHTSCPEGA